MWFEVKKFCEQSKKKKELIKIKEFQYEIEATLKMESAQGMGLKFLKLFFMQ